MAIIKVSSKLANKFSKTATAAKLNMSKSFNYLSSKSINTAKAAKLTISKSFNYLSSKSINILKHIILLFKNGSVFMSKNVIHEPEIIDPNFLIDILIKFILFASLMYILYKYFIIDTTVNYILEKIPTHIKFFIAKLKIEANKIITPNAINTYITTEINSLANSPSNVNTTVNDTNFAIIFGTIIAAIAIIFFSIIITTGGYNKINYKNIIYDILINLVIIIVSQLIFYYLIYSYIDPIKLYKLFYYNYLLTPPAPAPAPGPGPGPGPVLPPATTTTTAQTPLQKLNAILGGNGIPSLGGGGGGQSNQTQSAQVPLPNSSGTRDAIIKSSNSAAIFVFMVIFLVLFIIFGIITVLNILTLYSNVNIPNMAIPINYSSLVIYAILTVICMFLFIIMLLLIMSRV